MNQNYLNSDNSDQNETFIVNTEQEEDDLEIPAFLRRQKKLMVFSKINECHHKRKMKNIFQYC